MGKKKSKAELSNLPALHPDRVKAHLPSEEEAAAEAQKLSDLADTTKRSGAGGVIPGQVGIRPSGMGAFNEFHEKFTDGRKQSKKEKKQMELHAAAAGRYDGPRFKVVDIPFQLCIYCLTKCIDPGKPNYTINFHPVTQDNIEMFRPVGMIPGDVVRHAICNKCREVMKADFRSELQVMHNGEMVPQKYLKAAEHVKKMQENVVLILRQSPLQEIGPAGDAFRAGVGS